MPSTRAQVEENSEELNILFTQLVTTDQGDQDSLFPKGASSKKGQLQDRSTSSTLRHNKDQANKKMSTSPAEQVNKTRRTESNSTTNGTSSESEDDSSEASNQSEIETPLRLGTISQLILLFDGKMINYGIFNSQFDHLIDNQRYQARAEATCQALVIESSRRALPNRVLGARIHLASETLGSAVQSPSSTDCPDLGTEELGVPQRRLRVADKLS
ncbi:hypothetical protein GCK72_021602 [Caenorhabditis remanei]|uniref:Uncharacterized protein n=1 Tax=Caenorhabditis remanei TaxID=31234 RepID=A0A6A5GJY9_CAERE|nr:hypothetical protein GCK72_021602 [Caenorhabditis remanei]KAF1755034.1 hypothetical protein GCK72_021602 [Caenorhabditis remanei]